jgi:hypothetical protein
MVGGSVQLFVSSTLSQSLWDAFVFWQRSASLRSFSLQVQVRSCLRAILRLAMEPLHGWGDVVVGFLPAACQCAAAWLLTIPA